MTITKTRTLVECGLMVAMATILSVIPLYELPMGGTITLCSMAPIIIASYRHGLKWGLGTGATHSILQLFLGLKNLSYCATPLAVIGCILLDYTLAYTCLGGACFVAGRFKKRPLGIGAGALTVCLVRYCCSFLSGVLIWTAYAPEDMPVWLYSLTYNGSYMLPETAITTVAVVGLMRLLDRSPAKAV